MLLVVVFGAPAFSTPAQEEPADDGGFETLDALLDALESADADIERLSAKLLYEREYALAGDTQERIGRVSFVSLPGEASDEDADEGDDRARAFAVVFDTVIVGDRKEADGRTFVFDGRWLTERIPEEELILRREVAPPGSRFDPLKIGEGPLPLPLGQKKADILANYEAEKVPADAGIGHREDLVKFTAGSAQLVLIPNAARAERDDFEEIRLWYKKVEGALLPRMAMTLNKTGDEVIVRLWDVKLNEDATIDEGAFENEIPEGWEVDEERYRASAPVISKTFASTPVLARRVHQPEIETFDPPEAEEMQGLAPSVKRLLEAPYTTEEDAKDLRVSHGYWTREDLDTPERRARAALVRGDLTNDVFSEDATPAILRAEAMIGRGDIEEGLTLIEDDASLRAILLRTKGLAALGRHEDAGSEAQKVVDVLTSERIEDADRLIDGVLALIERARLQGPERADGTDFQTLMQLITRAGSEMDRLSWRARLAEAQLLYDKDERAAANEALTETLKLNMASAEAWKLVGLLAVDAFDFDRAARIADRLDTLHMHEVPVWVENASKRTLRSPLGAYVLAKARIRQGDAASALEIVDEALGVEPRNRELLAMRAAAHAAGYDIESAKGALDELDELSPGTERGYLLAGWALSERRQYAESAAFLEEAMRRQPNSPEAAILLGLLELQSGRDLNALTALRRVAELDPFNARAANSLELLEEIVGYETYESEHFVVRYKPGIDEVLAREMLGPLERAHARITGMEAGGIDHEPAQKTVIELMPDHAWFAVRIAGMPQIHTIAASTGPVIAMEAPRAGPGHKVGPYDWRRVIAHEYVHTVTLSRTNNRLPHWFTEAAAQYLEDAPMDEQTARLLAQKLIRDQLFDMEEINIKFTRPEEPSDRAQAYAQGLWMYTFLVDRFGGDAPLKLMDAYAEGRTEAEAMPSEIGVTPDAFLEEFRVWARDEVRSWGLAPNNEEAKEAEARARDLVKRDGRSITAETAEALETWADLVPVAEEPHRLLARYYLDQENGEARASEHLEFLDARAQYTPAYAAALAKHYAESGETERALDKALRAVSIAPYDADQRELAARVALVAGEFDEAEHQLEALTMIEPDRDTHRARLEKVRELAAARGG